MVFFDYFCLMIEGSGSVSLTNGSGSGRPKDIWILWIRIRIRNTDWKKIIGYNLSFTNEGTAKERKF